MLYPIPQATDFVSMLTYVQSILPFSQFTVLTVFFVSFLSLKKYETMKALSSSLFITFLSSLFFYLLETLEVYWVLGSAIALALTVILLYFNQREI